ncbi:MAG: TM2 domain-containing protein, partial [Chlorobiota bacterium]
MAKVHDYIPGVSFEELAFLEHYFDKYNEDQAREFAMLYAGKRKDAQTVLIMTLIAFLGVSGVQRFYLGQIGMGLLYLFTGGLCLIGTILDLVNNKKLTTE